MNLLMTCRMVILLFFDFGEEDTTGSALDYIGREITLILGLIRESVLICS
jgi:hypothetical protein